MEVSGSRLEPLSHVLGPVGCPSCAPWLQQRLRRLRRAVENLRQPEPIADRHFEIEFLDPGVEAYAFTFG